MHYHLKGFSSKHIAFEVDGLGVENILFVGVSASFIPEILQSGAVKGLKPVSNNLMPTSNNLMPFLKENIVPGSLGSKKCNSV